MSSESMINEIRKHHDSGIYNFNNCQYAIAKTSFINCINLCDRLLITCILLLL